MFDFFVEQILGMQWLNDLVWQVLVNYFHADKSSNWWSSIHFFFYDTIKITILLVTLIYLISYIQSYFPPEKTKRILTHFDGFTKCERKAPKFIYGDISSLKNNDSISLFFIVLYF